LHATAKIFSQISDQYSTVQEREKVFIYAIHRCPACWGRPQAQNPACFVMVGILQESLKWISGGSEFRVNEMQCAAISDPVCEFVIQKTPAEPAEKV
jgi:predicted hydrocarbon binding protein